MPITDGLDPFLYYLGVAGVLKVAFYCWWQKNVPENAEYAGKVTDLCIYPLKSARGITHDLLEFSAKKGVYRGVQLDRHWMVVSSDHAMVTGRSQPTLFRIQPSWRENKLVLSVARHPDLVIDPEEVEKKRVVVETKVHTAGTKGLDCGDEAARWICNYLQKTGLRLLYSSAEVYQRSVLGDMKRYLSWTNAAKKDDKLAFQDGVSVHLCGEESMTDLNSRLDKRIKIVRFRPNITVSTCKPFDEDNWKEIFIGNVKLKTIKLCDRCSLPTIDIETCERDNNGEPITTLRGYRRIVPGFNPCFGIDLTILRDGIIRVGDPIYVVRGDNTKPFWYKSV